MTDRLRAAVMGTPAEAELDALLEQLEAEQGAHDAYRGELDDANRYILELKEQLSTTQRALQNIADNVPGLANGVYVSVEWQEYAREALNPASEPELAGPDPDGPLFPDEWGEFARGNA